MAVVALATFVVESDHTHAVHGVDRAVLVSQALLDSGEAERRPVGAINVESALNACFNHLLLDAAVVVTHPGGVTLMQTPEHAVAACGALFADTPNGEMR